MNFQGTFNYLLGSKSSMSSAKTNEQEIDIDTQQ